MNITFCWLEQFFFNWEQLKEVGNILILNQKEDNVLAKLILIMDKLAKFTLVYHLLKVIIDFELQF